MQSDLTSFAALAPAYPEIVLGLGAMLFLLVGVLVRRVNSVVLTSVAVIFMLALVIARLWSRAARRTLSAAGNSAGS